MNFRDQAASHRASVGIEELNIQPPGRQTRKSGLPLAYK
jgi:hypothetical protein